MRALCIYTERYPDEMKRFFPADGGLVLTRGSVGQAEYIYVSNRQSVRARLQSLMEYIILCDNPALADGEKAFDSVAELAFRPTRGRTEAGLAEYLKEYGALNIEGYISFRMSEYSGRLNETLYSIVKKNLYNKS